MNWNEANSPVMGESDGNCTLVRNRGVEHEYRCCYSGLSGSPPSCSPVDFVVPGLDGFHFIVWGTEEGLVQVGYYQVGRHALDSFRLELIYDVYMMCTEV
jgi:hypothetical protein